MTAFTFTTDQNWDEVAAPAMTGSDTITLQDSAKLTIRTDTRWHPYAPGGMVGSLRTLTATDGEFYFDGTSVRWLEINGGAGTPAFGDTISQGAVSGTYLGFWASKTAAPTLALGAVGFIKLLSVSGGTFAVGALTFSGAGAANATSADVPGWIEVVVNDAVAFAIPRLGRHKSRGDWFRLEDTTGVVGQQLQVPTNGGGQDAGGYDIPTDCGVWVEDSPGAGTYEFWPALADFLQTATYTWANGVVVVTLAAHAYQAGDFVYLTFTSGAAGPNGWYEIAAVPTTGTFVVVLAGAGAGGNVHLRSPAKNGWGPRNLGAPRGETDRRQNFVRDCGNGKLQFSENFDYACTYTTRAQKTGTYTVQTQASTYTWVGDVVTVTYLTGHLLETGHEIYADFTSGDATVFDGLYTITVIDPFTYTFALPGSGAGGNVTARVGCYFAITAHVMGVNDVIYCTFTGGSAVTGSYRIYSVAGATNFSIAHAPVAGVTGGTVSIEERTIVKMPVVNPFSHGNRVQLDFGGGVVENHTIIYPTAPVAQASTYTWVADVVTVTFTNHYRLVGDWVYLYFTSGGATAHGVYQIVTVPGTTTYTVALAGAGAAGNVTAMHASFDVNRHSSGAGASGALTVRMTVGNTPVAGCKTRVPNIFLRSCATATRDKNTVNVALATRPDYGAQIQGEIDLENCTSTWYFSILNAFSVRLKNFAYLDTIVFNNVVSSTTMENAGNGTNKATVTAAEYAIYFYAALGTSTLINSKFQRGGPFVAAGHGLYAYVSGNITATGCTFGTLPSNRSSNYPLYFYSCENVTLNNTTMINGTVVFGYHNKNYRINNFNHVEKYMGYGNSITNSYTFSIGSGTNDVIIDGVTYGWGTIINQYPYYGVAVVTNAIGVTVRNVGTKASPIPTATFRPNYYMIPYIMNQVTGSSSNIRVQRAYIQNTRAACAFLTLASDYNIDYQNCEAGMYNLSAQAIVTPLMVSCNGNYLGIRHGVNTVAGQAATYGTHFMDLFIGDTSGRFYLALNEPTSDTAYQVTVVSGTAKWTGAGQLGLRAVGDQVIIEDRVFRLAHTGFKNTSPTLTGTNTGNLTYEYQIDTGSGYGGVWKTLNGANLSAEVVNPAIGFKMKMRLTCTGASLTNALTYVRVDTTSSLVAQSTNLYPLDYYTITLNGLQAGSKVAFRATGTETLLDDIQSEVGGSVSYTFPDNLVGSGIDITMLAPGYSFQKIANYVLTAANVDIPISQIVDYGYDPAATADVTFDGPTKIITVDAGITAIDVVGVYNEWITWALTGQNLQYMSAFGEVGGNDIDVVAGTSIPVYVYLINGWRVRPDEADHTLYVTTGVLLVDGGGDPFVDTLGAFTVRINYQQPVQAITVGGATPAELWAHATRTLTDGTLIAAAVRAELAVELARINANIDSRMASFTYTAPDNATIAAIDAKTTNLPSDPASTSDITALNNFDPTTQTVDIGAVKGTVVASINDFKADVSLLATELNATANVGTITGAISALNNFDPSTQKVDIGAVNGAVVTSVDDFKADVSLLATELNATANVGTITGAISALNDFDPSTQTVDIGAVTGTPVTSVDDFKADVSLLATELNATANKEDIIDAVEDVDIDLLGANADAYLDRPGTAGYYLARSANERGVVTAVDDLEIHVSGLPAIDHLYDNRVIQLVNIADPTLMETHVVVRYEDDGGVVLDAPLVHTVVAGEWYAIMLPVIDIYTEFTIDESYCIVFGVIKDVHGHTVPNTELLFKPLSVTQIIGNAVLSTRPKSVYTDSAGAFYLRLLRNAQVLAICQAISMRKTITVPNSPAVNIEDT
jgi:hypothetical protein